MNFLAKTITNLESKLDSVLLGEQEQAAPRKAAGQAADGKSTDRASGKAEVAPTATPDRAGSPAHSISRAVTPSGGGAKLTLAERLAAATARSASPGLRSGSPAPALESARNSIDRTRGSLDVARTGSVTQNDKGKDKDKDKDKEEAPINVDKESKPEAEVVPPLLEPEFAATELIQSPPAAASADGVESSLSAPLSASPPAPIIAVITPCELLTPISSPLQAFTSTLTPITNPIDYEAIISQLRSDLAICESRRQEESHTASERIDALESKLKILVRESADESKRRATAYPAGGLEKKLAEKEEKIALLLEEGEKLSKLELKNLTIIKKLRAKIAEDEKLEAGVKTKLEKAEKEVVEGKGKLKKAQETEKRLNEQIKASSKLEGEVERLRKEKIDRDALVVDLKVQLAAANARADDTASRVQTEAIEAERKTTRDLREQIDRIQSEATLMREKLCLEIGDLKAKIERDSERANMTEAELRSEVAVMETKVEVLRARAEEMSSGASGDTHSKLLRQVETLQTQYAIASENWQGIEGSLLNRVAAVERERDELARAEMEVRRKAREFNNKARRFEMDLESANSRAKDLEEDIESYRRREEALQKKITELDASLTESQSTLERAKEVFSRELTQRLEDQRMKWEEQLAASSLMRSPSPPPQRFSSRSIGRSPGMSERDVYIQPCSLLQRRDTSTSGSFVEQTPEGQRRKERPSFSTQNRVDSTISLNQPQFAENHGNSSHTSLVICDEDEDYFINNQPNDNPIAGNNRPSSGNPTQGTFIHPLASPLVSNFRNASHAQDMVSVSTVAAGPSVQLVERMSSSIRRLETEMAASRDELTRTLAQRDEARAEIVELMREVEAKRELEARIKSLEGEKEVLDTRFQAALETLGEKMERVDELEEMVGELKRVYRELVVRSSG
ncbi:TATA element modulatory factor 1 TATA binding-domain-containing protein [Tirmania nivea]|nr:TATA element modulatory factor 1 TATA binding-domain-containing protein [Tirmania nivea]